MTRRDLVHFIGKCSHVSLSDYSEYESERCCNGGAYGFSTNYDRLEDGSWMCTEHTTADFCPYCRSWNCNGHCTEPEYYSTAVVIKSILGFMELNGLDELNRDVDGLAVYTA